VWRVAVVPQVQHAAHRPCRIPLEEARVIPEDDWRQRALCRGSNPTGYWDPFFDEDPDVVREAEKVCRRCPVAPECLTEGLQEPAGMWGGFVLEERAELATILRTMSPTTKRAFIHRAATLGPRAVGVTVRRKNRR